ncbi:Anaphase-promoting complex [Macleaya cordata]|uniref:Anaphase-promoting complex n=1 Tax=Macleaya cordata TaxID=56857 RepID=A0A200R928_MACCD|nr:Anaphase-promoting complex [Macleaya cordata]
MLRRKPSKIEVKIEDKEELEEARKRSIASSAATTTTTTTTRAAALIHQLDRNKDPSNKPQRIGLSS